MVLTATEMSERDKYESQCGLIYVYDEGLHESIAKENFPS